MNEKALISKAEAADIARDAFRDIAGAGFYLLDEEALDETRAIGRAQDMAIKLATLHCVATWGAKTLEPTAVEKRFVLTLDGWPYDIAGRMDVEEATESTLRLGDIKTTAMTPPHDAARSLQLGLYAIAFEVEHGYLPSSVWLHSLVKSKAPILAVNESTPDVPWLKAVMARVQNIIEFIEIAKEGKVPFPPARWDSWYCTKNWCGYHETCPHYSGR